MPVCGLEKIKIMRPQVDRQSSLHKRLRESMGERTEFDFQCVWCVQWIFGGSSADIY